MLPDSNIATREPCKLTILHLITNLEGRAGAEGMLCRLISVSKQKRIVVVSMMGLSERNRALADNPNAVFETLGVRSPIDMMKSIPRIAKILQREQPASVVCWMYHAMAVGVLSAKLSGTKVPVTWNVRQSLDNPASLSFNTRFAVRICKMLSSMPAAIIYNSQRARSLHQEYGYSHRSATVIPNGFVLPDSPGIAVKSPRMFGIAGRFHPQKDYETFLRAIAIVSKQVPDARFKAAGEGVTAENPLFKALLETTGIQPQIIELCGEVDTIEAFYRSIDVLVLSSRTEGFPNVVAEAMSYGKPVVTTDVGDAASIVAATGRVVPPGNPEALAAAMIEMAALNRKHYSSLAKQARKRIESNYELEHIARQYDHYLETVSDKFSALQSLGGTA